MNLSLIAPFALTVTLAAMVPGPTTALVIRRAALGGARTTWPVIAGMEAGLCAWVVAAAAGLSALVTASEIAYTALRIAGAIVLVTLGVQAWLASRGISGDLPFDESRPAGGPWWRQSLAGLLTNLLNPKVAVFSFAIFPQFVPAGANFLRSLLLLGLLQILIDAGWFLLVATFVGKARKFFSRAKVRRRLERVTGTALIAIGASLAFEKT